MHLGPTSYLFLKIGTMSVLPPSLGNSPLFHVFFNHRCRLDFVCFSEYIMCINTTYFNIEWFKSVSKSSQDTMSKSMFKSMPNLDFKNLSLDLKIHM